MPSKFWIIEFLFLRCRCSFLLRRSLSTYWACQLDCFSSSSFYCTFSCFAYPFLGSSRLSSNSARGCHSRASPRWWRQVWYRNVDLACLKSVEAFVGLSCWVQCGIAGILGPVVWQAWWPRRCFRYHRICSGCLPRRAIDSCLILLSCIQLPASWRPCQS